MRGVLRASGRTLAFLFIMVFLAGGAGWWARGVALRGKVFVKSTGEAISDAALGLYGMRKDLPLASGEVITASPEGKTLRFIGTVSAAGVLDPDRHQFIVQDTTGGVLVDDRDAVGEISDRVEPGDLVDLVGQVRVWRGLRVFRLREHARRIGPGQPPKPVPLGLGEIGPEWLGNRVLLRGLAWTENQPENPDRAMVADSQGNERELRTGADSPILADRSMKRFDLIAIILGQEAAGGRPGEVESFFLIPLEIRAAPQTPSR